MSKPWIIRMDVTMEIENACESIKAQLNNIIYKKISSYIFSLCREFKYDLTNVHF